MSLRYPASWKTEEAQQEGVWYRYFLAPPAGPERKPAVSLTLVAGPLGGSLDDYAQTYLAGNIATSSQEESRQGARGKSYLFSSPDGKRRHSLLLLQEGPKVYGLFSQGEAPDFDEQLPVLKEIAASLTLERPEQYPETRNDNFAFSIRVPPSWKATRSFSGSGTYLQQFSTPAFGIDGEQPLHASLTLTVDPLPPNGGLESYYKANQDKLGEAFQVLSHTPWKGGYVDVLHSETPMAVSRSKRFYRAADGRGYSLALEARDDVYPRATKWCDMIASTLKVGSEVGQP